MQAFLPAHGESMHEQMETEVNYPENRYNFSTLSKLQKELTEDNSAANLFLTGPLVDGRLYARYGRSADAHVEIPGHASFRA